MGRLRVPALLRAQGLRLVTLAEHYGVPQDEEIDDITWLTDAGERGWVVVMKDDRIRFRAAERRALVRAQVRVFCLSNASLGADEMARRILQNLPAIAAGSSRPGPFLYAVHATRIEQRTLDP